MYTSVVTVLVGVMGALVAHKYWWSIRLRLFYNVFLFGSWVLHIVLGAILVTVANQVPSDLVRFLDSKDP